MRITTQMLDASARKAGLPVNNVSLLNYVNGNDSGSNLLSALKDKKTTAVNTTKKTEYEKLEKAADDLSQRVSFFTELGEVSAFAKARAEGDNTELYKNVNSLVDSYNSTLKALKAAPGTLNDFYGQSLKELVSENSELLNSIGVTVAKDGSLSVDQDKLKEADVDTLEKALGSGSDLSKKLSFLAGKIADNAETNLDSLSSQYGSDGSAYIAAMNNKYNLWG